MAVLNVALVGSENLARRLGKRGDVRDIESYVHKEEVEGRTRVLSFLRPLKHPESIRPLLSVLNVAKVGILEISELSPTVGESMVAFGCSDIRMGIAVISPGDAGWIDSEQVRMMLDQAGLSDWDVTEEVDEHNLRRSLFEMGDALQSDLEALNSSPLVLPVDQHFNVKGVGLVAIGYVQSGSLSKHDEVVVLPSGDKGVVRSLQVMDDDVGTAIAGDRVGVALRNLREQSLHRGCVISGTGQEGLVSQESSRLELEVAPFQKRTLSVGEVVHASCDLQFPVGRVSSFDDGTLVVDWETPLWIRTDGSSHVIIVQLDAMPMRLIGKSREVSDFSHQ